MEVRVLAPAKINLSFDIIGRRPDGYHDIETIMQSVSLCDEVLISDNDSGKITISCTDESVPCDESNIVFKAAVRFFDFCRLENKGIHIHIDKKIPSQAGLGGGSSDGAAVLLGLNYMFSTRLRERELCDIAERIGSDVPFCLVGGTRYATGSGTDMKKLVSLPKCKIVICKPDVGVSTEQAYQQADLLPEKNTVITRLAIDSIYSRSMLRICSTLYNDFEVALKLDEVNDIKRIMYKRHAAGASMSGSGSAVFAIFQSDRAAEKCADALREKYSSVFVCEPLKEGCRIL